MKHFHFEMFECLRNLTVANYEASSIVNFSIFIEVESDEAFSIINLIYLLLFIVSTVKSDICICFTAEFD